MSVQILYCPTCGAANEIDRSHCFACSNPLDRTMEVPLLRERYRLLAQLGTGGYGAVYQAEDLLHPELPLAIKQINLRGLETRQIIEATETFQREQTLLALLDHPNLPHLYDTFEDTEHWYLVIDYFPGETLETYLANRPAPLIAPDRVALQELFRCGLNLCDLLHYLHTRTPPIIFRDLKPGNIIRGPAGSYALIDFGIARTVKEGQLKDTIPLGSPGYAAPEQYGRAQTDARADIYSLGAILHQMLSGADPSEQPLHFTPLGYTEPTLHRLETLILSMVALDGEQRPASIEVVGNILRELQQASETPGGRIWTPGPGQIPPWSQQGIGTDGSVQGQQVYLPVLPKLPGKNHQRRRVLTGLLVTGSLLVGGGIITQTQLLTKIFPPPIGIVSMSEPNSPPGNSFQQRVCTFSLAFCKLGQLVWAPSQTTLALTLIGPTGEPGQLYFWNAQTNQFTQLTTLTAQVGPQSLTWAPNGAQLAVADKNIIKIWTISDQESLITLRTEVSANNAIGSLVWSESGEFLYYTIGQNIYRWDIYQQNMRLIYNKHDNDPKTLAPTDYLGLWLSPDGTYMASTANHAGNNENPLRIWRVTNGTTVAVVNPLRHGFSWLQWSPDSRYLTYGNAQNGLVIYDTITGRDQKFAFFQPIPSTPGAPLSAWSQNSQYLVMPAFTATDPPTAQVIKVDSDKVLYMLPDNQNPIAFSASTDGQTLAIAYTHDYSSSYHIWYNTSDGQPYPDVYSYLGPVNTLNWSSSSPAYLAVTAQEGDNLRVYVYG
jgi:eukaryotic-like serine/threonine-protein kinase